MAQDHNQPLVLPQQNFSVAPFRGNVQYSRAAQYPTAVFDGQPALTQNHSHAQWVRPQPANGPIDFPDRDYQVVSYEELEQLLPEPKPTNRVEVGLLPNGKAYAPKTAARGQYLLFPSKSSYILYFTHHYFSKENLSRDSVFFNMLTNRLILPLEKLIQAPRLNAINTTKEDVEQALVVSKIVCLEDMGDGKRGVRRIDRFPSEDYYAAHPAEEIMAENSPAYSFSKQFVSPSSPIQVTEGDGEDARRLYSVSSTGVPLPPQSQAEYLISLNNPSVYSANMMRENSVLVAPPPSALSITSNSPGLLSPNTAIPVNTSPNPTLVSSAQSTTDVLLSTTPNTSSTTVRAANPVWAHAPGGSYPGTVGAQHPLGLELNSVLFNNSTCPSYAPNVHANSLQACELPNPSAFPLRQPALPQYTISQAGHAQGVYPSFGQVSTTGSPMNFASATQQPYMTSTPFANPLFAVHSNQLTALNPHHTHAALTAAYVAMLQQQQQQAAYLHAASMPPNIHPQAHPFQPGPQSPYPFYYPAPPLVPAQFPRHPAQRLSQGPLYAYAYQPPPASVMHNPTQISSEVTGTGGKTETNGTFSSNGSTPQAANNIACPLFVQPHMSFHPTAHHPNPVSGLAAAATGVYIQRPPTNRQTPFGLGTTPTGISPMTVTPNHTPNSSAALKPTHSSVSSATEKIDEILADGIEQIKITQRHFVADKESEDALSVCNNNNMSTGLPSPNIVPTNDKLSDRLLSSSTTCATTLNDQPQSTTGDDEKNLPPMSADDSEDSASSGIGEMNSACSSSTSDAQTNSSCTVTSQRTNAVSCAQSVCRQQRCTGCTEDADSKT